MTTDKNREITELVNGSLDQAEEVWGEVGSKLSNRAIAKSTQFSNEAIRASVPTTIPGYEFLEARYATPRARLKAEWWRDMEKAKKRRRPPADAAF